jgi:hypothetical protein
MVNETAIRLVSRDNPAHHRPMSIQPAPGSGQTTERFASFQAFYPYYIHEHSNRTCRRIHVVGTTVVAALFVGFLLTMNPWWLLAMPVVGYGAAWIGHFVFEKNRPATFKYPLWSLMGDWRLWYETLTGQRKF